MSHTPQLLTPTCLPVPLIAQAGDLAGKAGSKVHAICVKCGQLASFSHRTVKNDKQVLLGETAEYEPLCRECYLRAIKGDRTAAGG